MNNYGHELHFGDCTIGHSFSFETQLGVKLEEFVFLDESHFPDICLALVYYKRKCGVCL